MMKANELMIGDWVAVCGTPFQIAAIGTHKAGFIDEKGEMFYHYYDNIELIPLSAEILEKNGFERTNDHHFFDGDEYYEMELREISDSIWFVEYTDLEFSMPSQRMIVCNVHELQHAINLFGITKKIEL